MKFIRFLTAGKGLSGSRGNESRYRMGDPRALPKFGAGKNPFSPGSGSETENKNELGARMVASALLRKATGTSEPRRPGKAIGLVESDSPRNPETPRLAEPAKESAAAVEAQPARRKIFSGIARLGEFIRGLREKVHVRMPKIRKSTLETKPVQCELSLDNVKVVRNDLSDSDFEIVTGKARPKTKAAPERERAMTTDAIEKKPGASEAAAVLRAEN